MLPGCLAAFEEIDVAIEGHPAIPPPATAPNRCDAAPHLLQSNEQRYRLLEGKHAAVAAEKEKLFQENEALRKVGPACLLLLWPAGVCG